MYIYVKLLLSTQVVEEMNLMMRSTRGYEENKLKGMEDRLADFEREIMEYITMSGIHKVVASKLTEGLYCFVKLDVNVCWCAPYRNREIRTGYQSVMKCVDLFQHFYVKN